MKMGRQSHRNGNRITSNSRKIAAKAAILVAAAMKPVTGDGAP
jgi:hypothetical protein